MQWQQQLETDGFAVVENIVVPAHADALCHTLTDAGHGKRNLLQHPAVRALVHHAGIAELVTQAIGPDAFAVRAIFFDKIEGKNWRVSWHQDQAIAIQARVDGVPGFGPTSMKDGVPHTRASAEVLEQMLAVRIHLDDCHEDNGPLRCSPGSHKLGRLDPDASVTHKERLGERVCTVGRGGVLLMRPLCLHASSPAASPSHRRVIHLEFAACALPEPLAWYEQQPIASA